ncbi:hypothetical protein JRQ81_005356 [Phrynocephalus forsythii]|uniref:MAGUK p55 subfamily member 3 n=1 Tax=Phrynocephalus forsythii TaxID=171643 RepID=A0A9Q0XGS5_9SAUR|nr:hypothetical protein JRQ81_005356 [Phrynocephalus forsythii]
MPVLSEDSGLHETLALLTSQLRPDSNHKEEMVFLRDIFSERSLSYLMKIHEKLCHYERQSPVPVLHSASALAEDVIEELQTAPMNNDEKELLQLLSTPHLRAMLVVHDTVAQKNFDPVLPPLPENIDDDFDEESVKIVRLVKNKEPLGATIRRDEHTGAVIVARIMRGGAADRSGLVHVGDELREVNGIAVLHKRPEEISQILPMFCREIETGPLNICHLLSSKKELSASMGRGTSFHLSLPNWETRKQGSLGSRLNELKQKVVAENPQEYGVAVPHTTRSKKSHEKEGVEYNFVSKQSFESDIQHNKFVEHGEYKENLYGTSLEAIQSVMAKNKICLVDVVPEAVNHLRTAEFKPYVVFVKPLVTEKKKNVLTSLSPDDIFVPLDEEQQEMVDSAAFIEEQYGHLIDTVLVKEDLPSACNQLKAILEKLSTDSFWVPVSWVRV